MSDVEKRLNELESLVWDLPNLIDLRLGRVESSYAEVSGRLSRIDRTLVVLQTDMRDLRGGVTRQLVAQDARLARMEERIARMEARIERMEERIERMEGPLVGIEKQMVELKSELSGLKESTSAMLAAILAKLEQH